MLMNYNIVSVVKNSMNKVGYIQYQAYKDCIVEQQAKYCKNELNKDHRTMLANTNRHTKQRTIRPMQPMSMSCNNNI